MVILIIYSASMLPPYFLSGIAIRKLAFSMDIPLIRKCACLSREIINLKVNYAEEAKAICAHDVCVFESSLCGDG